MVEAAEPEPEPEPDAAPEPDVPLQLPAALDLKAAAPLAAALLARRGAAVVVDAGGVQRLGGQCLQVLLAAQASWGIDARELRIEDASPEFCSAIELFGARDALVFTPKEPG